MLTKLLLHRESMPTEEESIPRTKMLMLQPLNDYLIKYIIYYGRIL